MLSYLVIWVTPDRSSKGGSKYKMTAEEFRLAAARLNMNYSQIARDLKITPTTTSYWAKGKSRIPYTAEIVIRKMLDERCGSNDDWELAK